MKEPFDPLGQGTPDGEWQAFLARFDNWKPRPGPLLVLAPHPDDEVLGVGGLIHDWVNLGHPVTVVSVTDGEAADSRRSDLDQVRRAELREALRKLSSRHIELRRLSIPDGRVRECVNRVRAAIDTLVGRSATVLAPFECDGHPDHEAVGKVALERAAAHRVTIARYPIWAWHHTRPNAVPQVGWKRFFLSTEAQRAKRHAIQCFASQLRPPQGPPIVPPNVLPYFSRTFEAFIV